MKKRPQEFWDRYFLTIASQVAEASKDPSTKVGALIVRPDRTVASLGYNGFPRGIADTAERLNDRDTKLDLVVHGEINALLTAREPVRGYTLYTWPFLTCKKCALQICQAGITRVVAPFVDNPRWNASFDAAIAIYDEVGVECVLLRMEVVDAA